MGRWVSINNNNPRFVYISVYISVSIHIYVSIYVSMRREDSPLASGRVSRGYLPVSCARRSADGRHFILKIKPNREARRPSVREVCCETQEKMKI